MKVFKSMKEPVVDVVNYDERINGPDRGLINAWFAGRRLAARDLDLSARAKAGELPVLGVKGGVEKKIKGGKIGSLWYVATWQGLRGEDLDVDPDVDILMRCARFGVEVLFTLDHEKLGKPEFEETA